MTQAPAPSVARVSAPDERRELTVLNACCAAEAPASDEAVTLLADSFKALADPARVKIMSVLLNADEVCACDIATVIGKSQATASHHLAILRKAGLITGEKRGTWVYYSAVTERLTSLGAALTDLR